MFPEDINTSGSWDLIDPRCDAEVADITGEQNQQPVNQTVNTSYDSTQANPNQGLPQVNQLSLNQHLGTLYNQDFFVTDTMGRRLSQIPDKSSYSYLLPNGHSVLQLRLPDLLIYLKMDTYLIDVHTGHHYAVYSDRIEKMSIFPKLYSTWEYKQLLQTIQNDAMHFGVNSPQLTTSEASNSEKSTSDRVNHLAWPHTHHGHHHHAGLLLSSMSHHPLVLNFPHRCSPKLNANMYFKIMLQLQMLLLTRLLFLKV